MRTPDLPSSDRPDVLGDVLPAPAPSGRRRPWLLGAAAAGVLAVAGAGAAAAFALSGGGAQPEDVVPGDALAFAKLDLDPAAGQKLNLFRLSQKFPAASQDLDGADSLRDDVLRQLFESDDVDYDREIAPWLGDRAGVAALPSGEQDPDVLLALACSDQDAAERALTDLETDEPFAFAFVDGFVLISDEQSVVDDAAASEEHLVDEPEYADAISALDSDQIAVAWVDLGRIWESLPADARASDLLDLEVEPSGQAVVGLRAESDAVELVGRTLQLTTGAAGGEILTAAEGSGLVRDLPAEAVVAIAVTGLDTSLSNAYEQILAAVGDAAGDLEAQAAELGIELPEDVATVVGSETALALWGDQSAPELLLRTRTDDPDAAEDVLRRALSSTGEQDALDGVVEAREDGLAIGSPAGLEAGGGLGAREQFRAAVPDAAGAGFVVWVSLQEALAAAQVEPSEQTAPLSAVGLTVTSRDDVGELRLRLTFR